MHTCTFFYTCIGKVGTNVRYSKRTLQHVFRIPMGLPMGIEKKRPCSHARSRHVFCHQAIAKVRMCNKVYRLPAKEKQKQCPCDNIARLHEASIDWKFRRAIRCQLLPWLRPSGVHGNNSGLSFAKSSYLLQEQYNIYIYIYIHIYINASRTDSPPAPRMDGPEAPQVLG